MLKSKLLLLCVIASVTLLSCKKESLITNSVGSSPSDALVKTKTDGNNVESYSYDNQNRISRIVFSTTTGPSYYHEFTYSNGAVSEYHSGEPLYELEQVLPNGTIKLNCTSNPSIFKLNTNGFYAGTTTTCQTQSYKYDTNGFIVNQDYAITDYNTVEQVINDNKNILQISGKGFSYGGGEFDINTNYDYYLDKISSIGNKNFGRSYLGKSSENLLKKETQNGETTTYTYLYDAQQRVIQKTSIKLSVVKTTSYTYY